MPYITGSATSMGDVLAALQSACTSNGWTLAGSVLSKGACYVQAQVVGGYLTVQGGTGIDGSNALTGAAPTFARVGPAWNSDTMTFPLSYVIHIGAAPDEVYLGINYEITRWQWAAFGCSPHPGLPGTGNWCWASVLSSITDLKNYMGSYGSGGGNTPVQVMAAFYMNATTGASTGFVHHGLDGGGWSANGSAGCANGAAGSGTLIDRLPSVWNGETVLVPIRPAIARPSGKVSLVATLGHSRYLRNDNLADGEIITLGTDKWRAYPWHVKNAAVRNVGNNAVHSGTYGWAIRYDGP